MLIAEPPSHSYMLVDKSFEEFLLDLKPPQFLFYFVPEGKSHSQVGSARVGVGGLCMITSTSTFFIYHLVRVRGGGSLYDQNYIYHLSFII